jgi:tetratricopeptide (TPR) repeat protein
MGLELDSLNKQLAYLQAFMSFNDYNFNSAKLYALKAYSLDNKYYEAIDVLGLSYFNEGVLLYNELINIDWKSSKYKEVENASNEKFNEALKYSEISLEIQPNNKSALDNAYKSCMKLGNIEKAKEYKARLDAIKD